MKYWIAFFWMVGVGFISQADADYQNNANTMPSHSILSEKNKKNTSFWCFLQGAQPNNALYLGMFSWHIRSESRKKDRASNNLILGLYRSIFFGTSLNSFSQRAFVLGVQRNVYEKPVSLL